MFLWLLFVTLTIIFYVKVWKPYQTWKERKVYHEKPVLFFGSMFPTVFRLLSFADLTAVICNRNKPHKYFGIYNFLRPALMVRDPEIIKQICVKDFDSFLDHQTFISEEHEPLFGKNIFSLKGQKWRHMRSTLSPAFTSSKMKSMFILMAECADQFTDYFLKNSTPGKAEAFEMKDVFTRYANDVIATCAFGLKCDSLEERENEFYMRAKEATDFSGFRGLIFFGYNFSPYLMKVLNVKFFNDDLSNFFRHLVTSTIKQREDAGITRPDMIQMLIQAKKGSLKYEESAKKEEDTGFATVEESDLGKDERFKVTELTDDDLTAQALIFFFAGFDAISSLMCHVANELAINPDVQERLQQEVDETLDNCKNNKLTYEALTKMKYMDMVVSETLRKWPVSPLTDRECTKTYTIKPSEDNLIDTEVTLYKGDLVWIPTFAIHRDPEFYPDPEKFDPERFNDDNKDNIPPFAYIPFGAGPRNCIGSRFVLLETKTVLVYLLSKFDIVVDKKTQIPLKLTRKAFNMVGEKGFWLGLKPRQKPKSNC